MGVVVSPRCILLERIGNSAAEWRKVGHTEQLTNAVNPDFATVLKVPFWFERHQEMKFVVINGDGETSYDVIGEIVVALSQIVGIEGQVWQSNLSNENDLIIIRSETINQPSLSVDFSMRVIDVNNKSKSCLGFLCKRSFPYYIQIERHVDGTPSRTATAADSSESFITMKTVDGVFKRDVRTPLR